MLIIASLLAWLYVSTQVLVH